MNTTFNIQILENKIETEFSDEFYRLYSYNDLSNILLITLLYSDYKLFYAELDCFFNFLIW